MACRRGGASNITSLRTKRSNLKTKNKRDPRPYKQSSVEGEEVYHANCRIWNRKDAPGKEAV